MSTVASRNLPNRRVLVIEDERDIAALVALHLREEGFEVTTCADGSHGLERAARESWELIVLDLSLPGTDGIEICRQLRLRSHQVPVLMLTARSAETDRVLGLDSGADDYLAKPFSVIELVARSKAILRRTARGIADSPAGASTQAAVLRVGDLEIDSQKRTARLGDRSLELTAREFDLLAYLARHRGRVFSRTQLLDQVWGLTHDAYEHAVSSHISRLRAKLEPDPAAPVYLVTVWGVGYRLGD